MGNERTVIRAQPEYHPETDSYRITYSDGDDPPSVVIPEAIATITDVDLLELDPLHEVVDPNALDDVFGPRRNGIKRGDGTVEFTYHGVRISVRSYGVIELRATDHPP